MRQSPETILFCVGAQKAGTTWLYDYLSSHPDCHVPQQKELHYFDVLFDPRAKGFADLRRTVLDRWMRRVDEVGDYAAVSEEFSSRANNGNPGQVTSLDYLKKLVEMNEVNDPCHGLYRNALLTGYAGEICAADITPDYCTLDETNFKAMADAFPESKFLFLMRDPLARTWSHLKMHSKWMKGVHKKNVSVDHLVEAYLGGGQAHIDVRSDYGRVIKALRSAVPKNRLLFLFYEDFFSDRSIEELCDFLGMRSCVADFRKGVRIGEASIASAEVADALRRRLKPVYKDVAGLFGDKVPSSWDRKSMDDARKTMPRISASSTEGRSGGLLFYGIGAQKSGTTWLSSYLDEHPEVFVPFHKEIDYFASLKMGNRREQIRRRIDVLLRDYVKPGTSGDLKDDVPEGVVADLCNVIAILGNKSDYMSLFRGRGPSVKAFGEMSPSYSLLSRDSYADMASRHPNTRFIFLMRDPVLRFWSSIRMWYTTSPEDRETKSIQDLFYERLRSPTDHVVLFSRYGRVINELEAVVPRDRIHYDFYEHIFGPDGQSRLDRLTDFLGVSRRQGALDRKVWETDTRQVKQSDLTQAMRDDAREVFDQVYKVVRARFGDDAPASWLWETDQARTTVASAGGATT